MARLEFLESTLGHHDYLVGRIFWHNQKFIEKYIKLQGQKYVGQAKIDLDETMGVSP